MPDVGPGKPPGGRLGVGPGMIRETRLGPTPTGGGYRADAVLAAQAGPAGLRPRGPVGGAAVQREGEPAVPRGHSEEIAVDGEAEPTSVKLGVFVSNTKARRDKLTGEQRAALAALGVAWA